MVVLFMQQESGSGLQRPVVIKHPLVYYILNNHNSVASSILFVLSHFLICDYYKSEAFEIFPYDAFRMRILCVLRFMAFANCSLCSLRLQDNWLQQLQLKNQIKIRIMPLPLTPCLLSLSTKNTQHIRLQCTSLMNMFPC